MAKVTAPISACLIHKDDPHLDATIASIRPWVAEVCIVSEVENPLASRLADRFEICRDYLGTKGFLAGRLAHFGAMRQRSFDLASQPYLLWLDADDVVVGAEHLAADIDRFSGHDCPRLLYKYEYRLDSKGRATHVQWRERLVRNDGSFRWAHRGHENLIAFNGNPTDLYGYDVIVKHERRSPKEPGLNRALIELEVEENGYDGWAAYNLGMESFFAAGATDSEKERDASFQDAISHLIRYIELSNWDDQRALAALKIAECHIGLDFWGNYESAEQWVEVAKDLRPHWREPHIAHANIELLKACSTKRKAQREHMTHVLEHCDRALTGETFTPQAVNLVDSELHVWQLKQAAHESLEQWDKALRCVQTLLQRDEDPTLRLSERAYEEKLGARFHAEDGLSICIVAPGFTQDPWDPVVLREQGVGGSETAVIEMAKRLVKRGHRVRVFGNPLVPGLYDGVEYHAFAQQTDVNCDVLIAWRLASMVQWCDAKVRLLWVHDTIAHGMNSRFALKADAILALSEWHRGNLVKNHKVHPNHVRVTRNGIDLARFDKTVRRNPHRAIYSSSPDRGLAVLLDLWPRIRAQVPDAELHVFYGFDGWRKSLEIKDDIHHRYVIAHIEETAANLPGVTLHGKVNQDELAEAMLGAGVWCSPTYFTETNCISVQEATAAGLRIVTSAIAALNETVGNRGVLIEGNWLSADYQRQFVQHVVEAMTWEHWGAFSRQELREYARTHFSWDGVADEWDAMMREMLDGAKYGRLPPYCPVEVAA